MKDAGAYYFIDEHEFEEGEYEFLNTFQIVINGLDNIEARRWVNKYLADLVKKDRITGLPLEDSIGY